MYPASGLGDSYTADDLPDAVTIKWPGHFEGSASKSGSGFTGGTVTLAVNAGGTAWELTDSADSSTRTVGDCLICGDGNFTPGDDLVEDQFEPTYNVAFALFYDYCYGECTVERTGMCTWDGIATGVEDDSGIISYESATFSVYVRLQYSQQTDSWFIGFRRVEGSLDCVNLDPEFPGSCEDAFAMSGPGPFVGGAGPPFSANEFVGQWQKWGPETSEEPDSSEDRQSAPNQGTGCYTAHHFYYYQTSIHGGVPLFGAKVT